MISHGGIRALQPKKARKYLNAFGDTIRAVTGGLNNGKFVKEKGDFLTTVPRGDFTSLAPFADFITQTPHEFIMCSVQHPSTPSCMTGVLKAFNGEWWRALSMYAPLNAVMTIIFNHKKILQNPVGQLTRFVLSTLRSVLFLTCYVTAAWSMPCYFRNLMGKESKWMYYVNGLIAGSMVLIEVPGRRLELGLYCMPRAIESLWNSMVNAGYARNIPLGECIYFSLSTGVIMTFYQNDPGCIHEGYF